LGGCRGAPTCAPTFACIEKGQTRRSAPTTYGYRLFINLDLLRNYMQKIITAGKIFIMYALIFGLIYPFTILGIGKIFFPHQAGGSLITNNNGAIIGSKLIAQEFTQDKYFHSRYSAINYDATNSGASNLAPSSKKLIKLTYERLKQNDQADKGGGIPADLVLSSGSGLDPHISRKNAIKQLMRVSKNRNLSIAQLKHLLDNNTDPDFIGIWGKSGINVLMLNLALDNWEKP